MAQEFKQGDKVEWNTPQGKTRGTVKKKLTSDTEVGGQKVNASEDETPATSSRARRAARRRPTSPPP